MIAGVITPAVELLGEAARRQEPAFVHEMLVELQAGLDAVEMLTPTDGSVPSPERREGAEPEAG